MLKSLFASLMSVVGMGAANVGSQGCMYIFLDELKMPKSLIK